MGILRIGMNAISKCIKTPEVGKTFIKSSSSKSIVEMIRNSGTYAAKYPPNSLMGYLSHLKQGVVQSFHLDKSVIPEVVGLEQKMKSMGVKVTFADNLEAAQIITSAVEKVKKAGLNLPERIILMTPKPDKSSIKGLTNCLVHKEILFLNKDLRPNAKNEIVKGIKSFSANTPESVVFHEIGHFLQNEPPNALDAWLKMTCSPFDFELAREVSWYSVTGDRFGRGREFVAEVFAGLMSGERYSPKVMSIYEAQGGVKIPGVQPLSSLVLTRNSSGIFDSITQRNKFAKPLSGRSGFFDDITSKSGLSKKKNTVSELLKFD